MNQTPQTLLKNLAFELKQRPYSIEEIEKEIKQKKKHLKTIEEKEEFETSAKEMVKECAKTWFIHN